MRAVRATGWVLSAALVMAAACGGDEEGGNGSGASSAGAGGAGAGGEGGAVVPAGHPRIYLNADNRARLGGAIDDGAAVAVRFADMVDAQLAGADYYAFAPHDAAMMGVLSGDPSYCDYAIDLTDTWVTSEEELVAAGERAEVAADSYLYVGDHVGNVALVFDWCYQALTPEQRTRWVDYGNQAVWNVWHPDEAAWGGSAFPWSGWSIDNPSNNYYYSFLRATMLLGLATLGENEDAQTWIDTFRIDKIGNQLVPTFDSELVGGGSREGTGYGVSMRRLFQLYDFWEATTGERIADLTPHTAESLANMIHLTVPTLDRIAPIGDHARDSTAALFDYHRSYVLAAQYLLGPADPLSDVAQTYLDSCSVPQMGSAFNFVDDFMYYDADHAAAPLDTLSPTYHAPGTGSVFFRSAWTSGGTWGAFIAGPYTESHAHRDQGSLLVYRSEWLAYDQNIESHSGIVQSEEAHNLVRIEDGGATLEMVPGQNPSELIALQQSDDFLYLAADITPIYGGAAALSRLEREVVFLEGEETFVVFDRADTSGGAEAVWQLNSRYPPTAIAGGFVVDGSVDGLDVLAVHPPSPSTAILDWTGDADMNGGFRLDLRDLDGGAAQRFLVLLAPVGAVSGTTPLVDGSEIGVDVTFASGAHAVLRFDRAAIGASLTLEAPGGTSLYDGPLAVGIDPPPLFSSP